MRKLKNGAYVIAQRQIDATSEAVLCWWERGEYVVWCVNQENGEAYHGSYTRDWTEAKAIFMRRSLIDGAALRALIEHFQENEIENCDAFNYVDEFNEQSQREELPSFYREYYACKARAASKRSLGMIEAARLWETICEKLYAAMPEPFKW